MQLLAPLTDPAVLALMGINVILALSLYLPIATGQFSLATGAFMGVGAYVSSVLSVKFGWSVLAALAVAAVATGLLGAVLGYPALRLTGLHLGLATIGLGELVRTLFERFEYTGGVAGFSGMNGITGSEILVAVCLAVGGIWMLGLSSVGRAMQAIREDPDVAGATGINVTRYKVVAFGLGAAVAALAGGLYAHFAFFISPGDFNFRRSVQVLMFLAFGGTQTLWGAVIGPVVLTLLPQMLWGLAIWREVLYGLVLVALMNVRPQALITRRHVVRADGVLLRALGGLRRRGACLRSVSRGPGGLT